jgi:LysM repeat protein
MTTTTAPVTTAAATTTTTGAPMTYTVKRGDTLSGIAKRFGVSVAAIAGANSIADRNSIKQGQVLIMPPPLPPTTTTTTPPPPPAKLVITPPNAPAGTVFNINLTGAMPGEEVTFEIDSPAGTKFTGPLHTATADGAVTTDYVTSPTDRPGMYDVIATGKQGTSARATFRLDPAH